MRACYIRLRSGWGSDGNVYNVLRGLKIYPLFALPQETKRGITPNRWTATLFGVLETKFVSQGLVEAGSKV